MQERSGPGGERLGASVGGVSSGAWPHGRGTGPAYPANVKRRSVPPATSQALASAMVSAGALARWEWTRAPHRERGAVAAGRWPVGGAGVRCDSVAGELGKLALRGARRLALEMFSRCGSWSSNRGLCCRVYRGTTR